jgi:hypothetical protein
MDAHTIKHIVKYEVIKDVYLDTYTGLIELKKNVICFILNDILFIEQHYIACIVDDTELNNGRLSEYFKKIKTFDDVKVEITKITVNKNIRVGHIYLDKYGKHITEYSKWYKDQYYLEDLVEMTIGEILLDDDHYCDYLETTRLERYHIRKMKLKEIITGE